MALVKTKMALVETRNQTHPQSLKRLQDGTGSDKAPNTLWITATLKRSKMALVKTKNQIHPQSLERL